MEFIVTLLIFLFILVLLVYQLNRDCKRAKLTQGIIDQWRENIPNMGKHELICERASFSKELEEGEANGKNMSIHHAVVKMIDDRLLTINDYMS